LKKHYNKNERKGKVKSKISNVSLNGIKNRNTIGMQIHEDVKEFNLNTTGRRKRG